MILHMPDICAKRCEVLAQRHSTLNTGGLATPVADGLEHSRTFDPPTGLFGRIILSFTWIWTGWR